MKRKASPSLGKENIKVSRKDENNSDLCLKESTGAIEYCTNYSKLPRDTYYYTELHYAAVKGDATECQKLIEVCPEAVTDATYHGYLPIDLAAKNGHFEACKVLKANMGLQQVYATRLHGHTILEFLAKKDDIFDCHLKIFERLIDDVPKNIHGLANNTKLLGIAILKGHPRLCEMILKKNSNSLNDKGVHGINAFRLATQAGFEEVIGKLIDNACLKDVENALLAEKKLTNHQNYATHKYLDHANATIISKVVSEMALEYITDKTDEINFIKSCNTNFYHHFKWLKLYQIMYHKDLCKDRLIDCWQTYQDLLRNAKNYYIENFFKLKGICKALAQDHLFAVLNDNFTKNTITMVVEQSFSDSGIFTFSSEEELAVTFIGENCRLG